MGGWGDSEAVHSMESKLSISNAQMKSYKFEYGTKLQPKALNYSYLYSICFLQHILIH